MPADLPAPLRRLAQDACGAPGGVGVSRARQLCWVARELALFVELAGPEGRLGAPDSPADWLGPDLVQEYLRAADAGELRSRGPAGRPSPDATRRVRRACLRLLAAAADLPDPVPDAVPLPALRERVEATPARLALARWTDRAAPASARPEDVRAAAMAVLVHEAGLRTGELSALTPDDLDLATGTLTYRPHPPATREPRPPVVVTLSSRAVRLLAHWLEVRAELVRATPRTRSLWVSLRANHDGSGRPRPAGLPLQPTGLRRAYARAVAAANVELGGRPGYAPLPRSAGPLRPAAREPDLAR